MRKDKTKQSNLIYSICLIPKTYEQKQEEILEKLLNEINENKSHFTLSLFLLYLVEQY